MKPDKTLCLSMIVKNESKVLKRLIDSCISIIDYYVIIDTGSTDDTIELLNKLLKKKKGEIHRRTWVNFGFNRSELMALSYGKADYILLADADNEYIIHNFDKNVLISDYYYLKYEGSLSWMNIFIVKGDIHWYYKGHVHEYIVTNGYSNGGCIDSIKIIHHGDGGNPNRNDIKILLNAIKEDPDDARNYFYLAQSYKDIGDYTNALIYYKKRILMDGWNEEVFYSLYQSGLMLYNLGEIDKSIITLMNSYNYRPSRFEPLYSIGWIYRNKNNYNLALCFFERILNQEYPKDILFVHKDQYDYLVYFELAICYYWIGDYLKAQQCAYKVKSTNNVSSSILKQNDLNLEYINNKLVLSDSISSLNLEYHASTESSTIK